MTTCHTEVLDRPDMQGLIMRGYKELRDARYYLLRIQDVEAFQAWLGRLLDEGRITNSAQRPTDNNSALKQTGALNLAFTTSGLKLLGVDPDPASQDRDGFSLEFREGLIQPSRSRILGDVGDNDPEYWLWGGATGRLSDKNIHCIALFFAEHPGDRGSPTGSRPIVTLWEKLAPTADAATIVHVLQAQIHVDFKEPFGFRDGISQPIIRFTKRDTDFSGADRELHVVEPGEFILGYENGHGRMPLSPSVTPERDRNNRLRALESYPRLDQRQFRTDLRDFGRNGTYMVLRQLEQDVQGFAAFLQAKAGSDPKDQRQLAAKIVGRWHDGAPLTTTPQEDPDGTPDNEFSYYANDRYGHHCPLGAHIRRGNPRDTFFGKQGRDASLERVNLHRVLRRGRVYGPPYPPPDAHCDDHFAPTPDQAEGRGIMFLVMNTDLRRQFEFVQQAWMNSDTFTGVSHEADPLTGARCRAFTIQQAEGNVRVDGVRRFVTVRGGAYFFMPGLSALRCLADPISA